MGWWTKITSLDRRWTFLAIALAAILPFLVPLGLAIIPTKEVVNVFDAVEALKGTGKPLVISFDFDPGTDPEIGPMAHALMTHAFVNDTPLLLTNFIYTGTALAELRLKKAAAPFPEKKYGTDYVFLGNKVAYQNVMLNMATDLRLSFSNDYYNTPISELPMMKGLRNYNDFGMVIGLSGTRLVEYWIIYGQEPFGFKYALGCTAVSATDMYPYLQTGQTVGMLGGMKGAAEYEQLLNEKLRLEGHEELIPSLLDASRGLDSQSLCHLVVIAFIIMGNIAYFAGRRKS
jgi:hypothetical protein